MTRLMIELPEDLEEKLHVRARQGGYADAQDYVRALIEADANELAGNGAPEHLTFHNKSELEKLLVQGIKSGDSREISAAEWDEKRRKLRERHSKRGSP
jgi:Arc/MetJ-type ribon-helix-helix transcriptional regulator